MKERLNILLSGGGTGGHIYPAIAIADELKQRHPGAEFLFVGAEDRMEMEKVPQSGYKIVGLNISGFQRSLSFKNLTFPFKVLGSLLKAAKLVKEFKPDVVIGTGGFASGPTLYMASRAKVPSLIQEQNSFPGVTNKLLGKRADSICVAYDGLESYFPKAKMRKTGNPVRQDLLQIEDKRAEAIAHFKLDPERLTLVVMGGSLGAREINRAVAAQLNDLLGHKAQLIWQTGKLYYEQYKDFDGLQQVRLVEFVSRMDLLYAAADLIVSRAGAASISELCIVGKPVIFIPSPNVAEDHQTKNAQAVVKNEAAVLLPEKEIDTLSSVVKNLMKSPEKMRALAQNIKTMALPGATSDIVDEVEKLIKK